MRVLIIPRSGPLVILIPQEKDDILLESADISTFSTAQNFGGMNNVFIPLRKDEYDKGGMNIIFIPPKEG